MLRRKKRHRRFIKNEIFKNYFISLREGFIALVSIAAQAIAYLGLSVFYILNFLYQKTKAALTLFCHWAMQYKIVQFLVHQTKEIAFAIQQICSFASVQFKTFFVNHVPIRAFVWIARVLPIGDWLKYEEQDNFGTTSFSNAIEDRDFLLLDRILKVCSQEALYHYLFMKDCVGIGPLQYAFFHYKKDTTASEKILRAIHPEKRVWFLNKLTCLSDSRLVIFGLVRGKEEAFHCEKVLELLPEKDKIHFMNQVDNEGDSPLILKAYDGENWETIKAFLDHYPKEHLVDYLNIKNERKDTFLTEAVQHSSNNYTEKIIELVPEQQRAAYLAKHSQGLKALLYAKSLRNFYAHYHIAALEKYGIKVPEEYANLSGEALKEKLPRIFEELDAQEEIDNITQSVNLCPNEQTVRENFKLKHGVYPLEVLQIEKEDISLNEIKTAYKKLVLFSHPDKNKDSEESTEKTTLINEAYGVYTKPETRKSYYVKK